MNNGLRLSEAASHGVGSSWIEHTAQVNTAAQDDYEFIGTVCHDIAKLTTPWSQRALNNFLLADGSKWPSPHHHAVWGASFAYLILKELYPERVIERFAIFHAVAAHHSSLGTAPPDKGRQTIISDEQIERLAWDAMVHFNIPLDPGTYYRIWKRTAQAGEEIFRDGTP
jgi:hypothetical protein